jgi:hypothetical protein
MNAFSTFDFVPFPYARLVCAGAISTTAGNEYCERPKARATQDNNDPPFLANKIFVWLQYFQRKNRPLVMSFTA